jgi:hypothetical protein
MTTNIQNGGEASSRDDRRQIVALFPERSRGVQPASGAFEDDGARGVAATERARAWSAILAGNLI